MGGSGRGNGHGDVFAARGLSVTFGGLTALQDVSAHVGGGEVLGVIGPNGAGKTTLFNVICGFVRPRAGSIEWQGETLGRVRPNHLARLGIARTLQGLGLFRELTVLENVMAGSRRFQRSGTASSMLGLRRSRRDEGELRDRALKALSELGCEQLQARLHETLP